MRGEKEEEGIPGRTDCKLAVHLFMCGPPIKIAFCILEGERVSG